ncbi:hypothetical protein IFM89_015454 [Coptis chinensis]|uniref:Sec-independent protein translocase protein TATB, chloroplastic n=1 Tax=Coptis chinensis TaxID=261450 RepID=A0A835I811_9MAGN|nr:hypothetical protein IFM89_015454 [Coptis chinensis]
MASTTISTTSSFLYSTTQNKKKTSSQFSISASLLVSCPQTTNYPIPQLCRHGLVTPWTGLKQLVGVSVKQKHVRIERKGRCKGKVVYASLFGVGAPEALVIGVVALLVFGPKGLAEVARNLGKTLRAFQPTIRELQDVSREFKSTLEREIGLDDIPPSMENTRSSRTSSSSESSQTTLDPNGTPLTKEPYSTEEYLKTTEEQLRASGQQQTPPQDQSESQSLVEVKHFLNHEDPETPYSGSVRIPDDIFLNPTLHQLRCVHHSPLDDKSILTMDFSELVSDDALPTKKPFNIGELLVEAQIQSSLAAQKQKQTVPQEAQSELEPQPKEGTPTSPPKKPDSEI